MDVSLPVVVNISVFFAAVSALFYTLISTRKIKDQFKQKEKREEELKRKVYETEVLREIGERIGYSLNGAKVVEIISGSIGDLLPYSTICYMIFNKGDKINFACRVHEPIGPRFIGEVRNKMLTHAGEIMKRPVVNSDIDESISGDVLDDTSEESVRSYFNLPIFISEKLVGMINVSSKVENLYSEENTSVLFRIARHASIAATKLSELLENEKGRLSQAVQSLSDGVLMVDVDFHLVLVNRKLSQLLGLVTTPKLFDVVNALSGHLDLRSLMEEATSTHGDLNVREIVVKDKVLQVLASQVMDKDGDKALGVVVLFHDVTDLKSLEKLKADFTSMMVHELRAPLTSIKSTVDLLKKDFGNLKEEDSKKFLQTIEGTSQSMLEVVNDLLDVAKMESGKFDVVCEEGRVEENIIESVENFKAMGEAKNIKISAEINEKLPEGYFDKVRIKQVFNNLISNAIKFTQKGEIMVRAEVEREDGKERNIIVSVSDTGIGIDPEEGSKLFSRFGQLVRSRRTAALKGSGLGLYIAKGIVEAWDGTIWYKSDGAGMGSTFFFTIPVAEKQHHETEKDGRGNFQVVLNKAAQA